jgi:drug/metabolite transporter (DMT)-like permease
MGLFGSTLYYVGEYTALTYTSSANVSIIIAAAPILTAIVAHIFTKDEKISKGIILGFLVAFVGVIFVVFNGSVVLQLNPLGDMLALFSALSWAIYSVFQKSFLSKMNLFYFNRKVMLYGALSVLPIVLIRGDSWQFEQIFNTGSLLSLIYLGVLASGICYVMWSKAFATIGTVTTNNYLYITPFISMIAGAVVLDEIITPMCIIGAVLIVSGVILSQKVN